ncbi:MOXD1 homolog 1-like isoform X1 [Schistocerca serialis cubense]|uniref:MOXD1 homolog 1-like isoform X1 n=2 Tax=Schistocerca TaxID=7008 RepID=UPI00214F14D5|nr:MOXD1 homolog 1-like isoform X1 [Schistocerca serialis cubense]
MCARPTSLPLLLASLALLTGPAAAAAQHSVWLAAGRLWLSWELHLSADAPASAAVELEVTFPAHFQAAGVGFSPKGGMAGADMALVWFDSRGMPYVADLHGTSRNTAPDLDSSQDYYLVGGSRNDTHSTVRYRRRLDTCDKDDMILGSDTVRVIWSLHEEAPQMVEGKLIRLQGHKANRGTRSLHLIVPPELPRPNAQQWDVTLRDFIIPDNMDTIYQCKIFKAPPVRTKHHIIGYEPILTPGTEHLVHHMLLYECGVKAGNLDAYVHQKGAPCYGPEMPRPWEHCLTPIVTWAIGSTGELLPQHVGLPLSDSSYFMLEVHYDNPSFHTGRDSSGVRVFHTDQLRHYDGGILVSGITITPLHVIPPGQPAYRTAGYCSGACTNKLLPQSGVKLVSVLLHSHLAGKALRLRHVRDKKELKPIVRDDSYDFNYQQARRLQEEVEFLPGDELVTECVYQTSKRKQPTYGGFSTKQEMCLAFVLYYPKTNLAACYSMTPVKYFFETFNVKEFYDVDMDTVERMFLKIDQPENSVSQLRMRASTTTTTTTTAPTFPILESDVELDDEANAQAISVLKRMRGFTEEGVTEGADEGTGGLFGELVIREPEEFRNRSLVAHLQDLPWSDPLLASPVEQRLYAGKHMVFCRTREDDLAIPADVFSFPNLTDLPSASARSLTLCHGSTRHPLQSEQPRGIAAQHIPLSIMMLLLFICALHTT